MKHLTLGYLEDAFKQSREEKKTKINPLIQGNWLKTMLIL